MAGIDEEILHGGVANRGAVVRVGDTVRRPAGPWSEATRVLLSHLESGGFEEAPRSLGVDDRGRDVLSYIGGEVPLPPFPAWSMTDAVLVEVAGLLGRFHQATAGWVPPESLSWSDELPDPVGGPVVCHNDVCPENVVFRDGRAVGLVDFDFAAPGRPEWDVVRTIGMWAPLGDPTSRRAHPPGLDAVHRFGIFAAASGIGADGAEALVDLAGLSKESGLRFVRRRLDAAEPAFVEMWEASGGDARWAGDRAWLEEHRRFLAGAVVAAGS